MPKVSQNDYYFWRKNSKSSSWQRGFLNVEFLKHEKKQIETISEWYSKEFSKAENNSYVKSDINFYALPVELSSNWKAAIHTQGNFNYFGLSALQNSPSFIVIGLFPYESTPHPNEYSLIRITKAKKIFLLNVPQNIFEKALIIEEWENIASDSLYIDVPYEKNSVQKIFQKHLSIGKSYASSLQAPLLSAPYVPGSVGGISLSSLSNSSTFAPEFMKTLQLMVPPEYRSIPPPDKAYLGKDFKYLDGITIHLAERPNFQKDYFTSFYDSSYNATMRELENRKKFPGEYSIFSTISSFEGTAREVLKDFTKNFTATEITFPERIDDIKAADVYIPDINADLNEDLWIQIANAHQLKPSILSENQQYINTVERVHRDFDAILSESLKDDKERESTVNWMMNDTQANLRRLAQSLARSFNRMEVNKEDFDSARGIIVDNFAALVQYKPFTEAKEKLEKSKSNAKFAIVQECIRNLKNPTAREIFEEVVKSGLFKDTYDLQALLDWMRERGLIILDINKRYIWL